MCVCVCVCVCMPLYVSCFSCEKICNSLCFFFELRLSIFSPLSYQQYEFNGECSWDMIAINLLQVRFYVFSVSVSVSVSIGEGQWLFFILKFIIKILE